MSEPARLQKLIAHSGITSRRGAEEMIKAGRVTVDGQRAHLGQKVVPESAVVELDGVRLPVRPDLVYYLVNKPAGVVSTAADPHGRPTLTGLVPREPRVFPVGRLDVDSEGLILLTNDGDLTNLLTHPRHGVAKTYTVLVAGVPSVADVQRLATGLELDDGFAAAQSTRLLDTTRNQARLEVVMAEGRKREVRRMCDAIGYPVIRLFRTAIGPLRDPTLRSGQARLLTVEEVRSLYSAASVS
ncbi:MAG: pseudouridine synthase [Acidimicrobiia bacterium]|nr:pseudouridine synthase [Acidimicrobiia bacterium]